jgi:hypothetical protein
MWPSAPRTPRVDCERPTIDEDGDRFQVRAEFQLIGALLP